MNATNTRPIADAGAALLAASTAALGKLLADGSACGHVPVGWVALAFAGIVVGGLMCYLGRPVTA